jgi:hypothetical protein
MYAFVNVQYVLVRMYKLQSRKSVKCTNGTC